MRWRSRRRKLPSITEKISEDASRRRKLPSITVRISEDARTDCYVAPNHDQRVTVFSAVPSGDGAEVGNCRYGISPLGDKLYLYSINIDPQFQHQGYGLSLLRFLYQTHGLPITPVHQFGSSNGFWAKASAFPSDLLVVTQDLRTCELDD